MQGNFKNRTTKLSIPTDRRLRATRVNSITIDFAPSVAANRAFRLSCYFNVLLVYLVQMSLFLVPVGLSSIREACCMLGLLIRVLHLRILFMFLSSTKGIEPVGVTDQRLNFDLWPPPHAGVYMCDVIRLSHLYTRDQLIVFRHDDPPDEVVRALTRLLFLRRRGCRAGQHQKRRLQPYYQATGGAGNGHIPIIISNRSSSRPPLSPPTAGRCLTRIQRAHKPIRLGCTNIRSLPTLYVFNAAALSKLNAVQHLAADLVSTGASVAVITETHFKQKHTDCRGYRWLYVVSSRQDRQAWRWGCCLC